MNSETDAQGHLREDLIKATRKAEEWINPDGLFFASPGLGLFGLARSSADQSDDEQGDED